MEAFIVYSTYKDIEEKTVIQLFGRQKDGKSFSSIHEFRPYFFIKESDEKKIKKLIKKSQVNYETEKTNLKNFQDKKVSKIISQNQQDLIKLYKVIRKKIETYEADLKPHTRFLMDNNIFSTINIPENSEKIIENQEKIDLIYKNPKIKPSYFKPELKILSLDIESSKIDGDLYCVGLYSKNYKKNFIISNKEVKNSTICKNEQELLLKLKEEIIKFDPDIITGWNVIDFDLSFLLKKYDTNKIPFDIGRTNERIRLKIENNFFKSSKAIIHGRQVLDGLNLIKDPFIREAPLMKKIKFNSYALENVSQQILQEGKLIKGKHRHNEIDNLYKTNKEKVVEYNIQDCKLVFDILEKTKIIDLAIERISLTGMPLNKLTASISAFDSLYIREANKKGFVSPTTHYSLKQERIKGGYVMQSTPGIYHNVLVLDFKSLYPSIIKTFNIDPLSFVENPKNKKDLIESPNKAYFKNEEGILPGILENLHNEREKAKKEKKELSSYAIKIIMNSFFGVLASPSCRYFSLEMANAITHFGQEIIKLTAKKIEEKNHKVIYSDTDSVFVKTNFSKEKSNQLGSRLSSYINNFYKEYVKKNYKRKSYLELEFEKLYISFLMPKVRGSEIGSKKRYAGLIEKNNKEEIEITGLEAIRGDWTEAAKEFQLSLLDKVFHKKDLKSFIKEYVKKIESGKMDEKLIYRKTLRKNPKDYTKTTPPHVKAARKLDKIESNLIEYYQTTKGPEPIQNLKHQIDYDHYIEKQIKPIANSILYFFKKDFDEILQKSKQTKLFN
jgi:DNA polymerase II